MTVNFEITKITGGDCNEYPFPNPLVPPGSTYQLAGDDGSVYGGGNLFYSGSNDYLWLTTGSFSGIPVEFRGNGKLYQGGYGGVFPSGVGIGTWEDNESGMTVTLNGQCPSFIWGCGNPGTIQFTWLTNGTNVIPATVPCGNLG